MDFGKIAREVISELELSGQMKRNTSGGIVLRFTDEYELERFLEPILEHAVATCEEDEK